MVCCGATPGPFFVLSDGGFLTRERFVRAVWEALLSTGLELTNYAGHSFRIGAATTVYTIWYQEQTIVHVLAIATSYKHFIYTHIQ